MEMGHDPDPQGRGIPFRNNVSARDRATIEAGRRGQREADQREHQLEERVRRARLEARLRQFEVLSADTDAVKILLRAVAAQRESLLRTTRVSADATAIYRAQGGLLVLDELENALAKARKSPQNLPPT